MANRSSEAYDFELFEPRRNSAREPGKRDNVIRIPRERLEKNRRPKPRPFRIFFSFLAFTAVAGILGAFVYGQVQLTELTESLDAAKKTLTEQQGIYTQAKLRSDSKLSLQAVESYAAKQLGMKKAEKDQTQMIRLSAGDRSEVVRKSAGGEWLDRLLETAESLLS